MDHIVRLSGSQARCTAPGCNFTYRSPFGPQLVAVSRLHAMCGATVLAEIPLEVDEASVRPLGGWGVRVA